MKDDEYVSKKKLFEMMCFYNVYPQDMSQLEFVDKLPNADVQEVRHGYWSHIRNVVLDEVGTCSVCGERRDVDSYCSNCGAIMDSNMEEENIVLCKDCKYLMFRNCYGECKKGYRGIVNPDDTCEYGVRAD